MTTPVYFSTALSLAEGKGYTLVSLPGHPSQTKYPVLYPWFLSWVWKLHPSFPANVMDAKRLTTSFGCLYLIAVFTFLRREVGAWPALGITAVCAFHPLFDLQTTNIYSDAPFMALAMAACLAADAALQPRERPWAIWAAAALAGMSVLTRSLGVAVIGGIVLTALHRKLYRRAAAFAVAVSPVLLAGLCTEVDSHRPA